MCPVCVVLNQFSAVKFPMSEPEEKKTEADRGHDRGLDLLSS